MSLSLPDSVDVLVVGAGHTGLAMSALLAQAGRQHLVVERRDRLGGGWQDRWDEFRLVTPNWTASFPGWAYDGPDPDGFMTRDEIAARVARYAEIVDAPVALGTEVLRLTPVGDRRFRVTTGRGELAAREVVVATGSYHAPRIPPAAARISERVTQLHSHDYRNEAALPAGAVLVVARARPASSWRRSCSRRAGGCSPRWGRPAAYRGATAAATSSAGWSTSSGTVRPSA